MILPLPSKIRRQRHLVNCYQFM